jgi:hypothetical protein
MTKNRAALCLLFLASIALRAAADDRKVVIPFDFVSKFDDGRYGRMLGDMVWKKLSREKQFILPESMLDVREYCTGHHLQPSPEMGLAEIEKIVREGFDAQIGVWGSVERAGDAKGDVYDIEIRCADFSVKSKPKMLYQISTQTESVSEIPHLYVKELIDAICGRQPGGTMKPNPSAEENWKTRPNLVTGDFEQGAARVPKGWEKVAGQKREPLGSLVQWIAENGNPRNKVIRFTLDKNVAENEGVMYYSDYFPIEEGATYHFQCRWRTNDPSAKVFIKCYDEVNGQRREVYRSQQNLKGLPDLWNTHTEDFTPKHPRYSPKWGRVMLYAYLMPGEVEFDDIVVKQILTAPTGQGIKVRRPSSATKVTVEEMQQNERRSREAGAK